MKQLQAALAYNRSFVEQKAYQPYVAGKYPQKKVVIVTCMDTRLTELLPKALNIQNGDAKLIKVAGAYLTNPYGGGIRSVLLAVSVLKAKEVWVIGHHECGFVGLQPEKVLLGLQELKVAEENIEHTINNADLKHWLTGPSSVEEAVKTTVNTIKGHQLFPKNVFVQGLVIHPKTGKLDLVQ